MRYAVLSDIHANLEALSAVLEALETLDVQHTVCCGDIVGYYSNPNECVDLLRDAGVLSVMGNHDRAAASGAPLSGSSVAVRAMDWTRGELTQDSRSYLGALPATREIDDCLLLFHGALHPPHRPENLHLLKDEDIRQTAAVFQARDTNARVACYGHTHRRAALSIADEAEVTAHEASGAVSLETGSWLINPGSVGQPRDGTDTAWFAVIDTDASQVQFHSVAYDRAACLAKARDHGLLPRIGDRISQRWRRFKRKRGL